MKRYNWEYNGETIGLIERDNGICVLYSDVVELNETIESLRAEVERIRENNKLLRRELKSALAHDDEPDWGTCICSLCTGSANKALGGE